jgi:uncharacterized protein YchJ
MMAHIRFDIVHHIFHINLTKFDEQAFEKRREQELEDINLISSDENGDVSEEHGSIDRDEPKVGRNDDCPCGSGKKYKKCHGE